MGGWQRKEESDTLNTHCASNHNTSRHGIYCVRTRSELVNASEYKNGESFTYWWNNDFPPGIWKDLLAYTKGKSEVYKYSKTHKTGNLYDREVISNNISKRKHAVDMNEKTYLA